MKKSLITLAIASIIASGAVHAEADWKDDAGINDQHLAIGVGAVSGAILAGPFGMIAGGIIGNVIAATDTAADAEPDVGPMLASEPLSPGNAPEPVVDDEPASTLLASVETVPQVVTPPDDSAGRIEAIVMDNLRLPVHFKSGSTDVETFYTRQLDSIAKLLHEFPEVTLRLEGYSDRQGDETENMDLSLERLESVRGYFTADGIDGERIETVAHGEKHFVSAPGDLDAYVFDRRVVISLKRPQAETGNSFAAIDAR